MTQEEIVTAKLDRLFKKNRKRGTKPEAPKKKPEKPVTEDNDADDDADHIEL